MRSFVGIRRLRLGDCRGQSLVEFALVAVVLVALVLGVVEIGRMVLVYNTVANAARVGTRYAIVHGSDNSVTTSQIQTAVDGYLHAGTVTTANATVTVSYPDPVGLSTSGCTSPGCRVSVSVSYPYDPVTSYFSFNVTLSSTSEGVITW